jgi:hypothetical protein
MKLLQKSLYGRLSHRRYSCAGSRRILAVFWSRLFRKEPKPFYRDESIPLKLSTLMLKRTNPFLTPTESKAISVFRLSESLAYRRAGLSWRLGIRRPYISPSIYRPILKTYLVRLSVCAGNLSNGSSKIRFLGPQQIDLF